MTLALRSPAMVKDIVSVDNAPIDAILSTDFAKYVRGMKKIEDAGVTTQKAADAIMAGFEEVCPIVPPPSLRGGETGRKGSLADMNSTN